LSTETSSTGSISTTSASHARTPARGALMPLVSIAAVLDTNFPFALVT